MITQLELRISVSLFQQIDVESTLVNKDHQADGRHRLHLNVSPCYIMSVTSLNLSNYCVIWPFHYLPYGISHQQITHPLYLITSISVFQYAGYLNRDSDCVIPFPTKFACMCMTQVSSSTWEVIPCFNLYMEWYWLGWLTSFSDFNANLCNKIWRFFSHRKLYMIFILSRWWWNYESTLVHVLVGYYRYFKNWYFLVLFVVCIVYCGSRHVNLWHSIF